MDIFARFLAQTTVHEILHSLINDRIEALTGGDEHTPELGIFTDIMIAETFSFFDWTGIGVQDVDAFPDPGSFVDAGFDQALPIGEVLQAELDATFPVPPAFQ